MRSATPGELLEGVSCLAFDADGTRLVACGALHAMRCQSNPNSSVKRQISGVMSLDGRREGTLCPQRHQMQTMLQHVKEKRLQRKENKNLKSLFLFHHASMLTRIPHPNDKCALRAIPHQGVCIKHNIKPPTTMSMSIHTRPGGRQCAIYIYIYIY